MPGLAQALVEAHHAYDFPLYNDEYTRDWHDWQWHIYIEANEAAASVEIRLVGAWLN